MYIIYFAVLIAGMFWVIKTLAPEMAKPPLPKPSRKYVPEPDFFQIEPSKDHEARIIKLENLLAEKNKNIELLQKDLKVFYIQIRDSDKVRSLLEEEIRRLREQNRIFRSELGMPTIQPKEQSIN